MFLRSTVRKKDGKTHRSFSVVENHRLTSGKVAQRTVLYLGEINDSQQTAWRKTLDVVDETAERATAYSLFAEDREIPPDAVDAIRVKLSAMELRRARSFGNCWLGCEVWRELGLRAFSVGNHRYRRARPAPRSRCLIRTLRETLAVRPSERKVCTTSGIPPRAVHVAVAGSGSISKANGRRGRGWFALFFHHPQSSMNASPTG